jgi:outer membrane protein, heavy metal efflux system
MRKSGWKLPRSVILLIAGPLVFVAVASQAQENPSLDSLRLGPDYLHWTPGAGPAANQDRSPPQPSAAGLDSRDSRSVARRDGPAIQPAPAPGSNQSPVPSAPVPPPAFGMGLSLVQLEEMAEHCNPTLAQAEARVEAARGEWLQAGLYPNPRVGYRGTEIGDDGRAGQQGAFVGQEFILGGKLDRSREAANRQVQQAQCALAAQRCRVLSDVRRAFYDVLAAQRTIDLSDQLVRVGEEGVRATEEMLKAQEVSRVDVLQARIEADSARIFAQRARNRHNAAWQSLVAVVGSPDMPPAPLAGDIQDGLAQLTWPETLQRVFCTSPLLAEAQAGVARAVAAVDRELAARVPNVELELGAQYDNATGYTFADVQASIPVPVFNRNQGNIRRAEAEVALARGEVRRTALELQQRLATTFEQYENARCQVNKYALDILPNAQESLNLVAAGYRQGEFNYVTLLTAQRTFFQANLAYIEALRDLRTAIVAIEGNLLSDSLQQQR